MAQKDKEKWNEKYKNLKKFDLTPSEILVKYHHLAKKGKALDVACGLGRNSIFLKEKGFLVDAFDISDVAIDFLKKNHPEINAQVVDFDEYTLNENKYELIVNVNFLDRNLIPQIRNALKPEGVVIFETFLAKGKKKNKKFYLQENELLRWFVDFHIVYYEEKEVEEETFKAFLVAIKRC